MLEEVDWEAMIGSDGEGAVGASSRPASASDG
jgi:hypothetical protein